MSSAPADDSLASDVCRLLEVLATTVAAGNADVTVETSNAPLRKDIIAYLLPRNPRAARVTVHVEEGVPLVDVMLGRGGMFEVPTSHARYTDLDPLDEVRALCVAAINGEYRETIWTDRGDVVRSHGTVRVGSAVIPVRWRMLGLRRPFRKLVRADIEYEPYDVGDLRTNQ